jgi:hypothetical protein
MIDRILIPSRYTFFSRSPTEKNSEVKHAWPRAISGWVTDQKVFLGAHKWGQKCAKILELVCGASLWSYVATRSNDCQIQSGWSVTNGIRVELHGFMGAYGSVEKDTVAYRSGMWVRTHDAWVLWEGHGMVRMLLTEHMVCVSHYYMYGHGQEGTFLAWGWSMRTSVF